MKRKNLITRYYMLQNQKLHEKNFGGSGWHWRDTVADLIRRYAIKSWLDYGCGRSTLIQSIKEKYPELKYQYFEYDPCVPGKKEPPFAVELVTCTDVLEHIEPDKLGNVLSHLTSLTLKIGFFVAATRQSNKKLPDGRNTHLIVEGRKFWSEKLKNLTGWESMAEMITNRDYKDVAMIGRK